MTDRIVHSLADEEIDALSAPDQRSFAVRLSFSATGDGVDAAFEQFLRDAALLTTAPAPVEVFSVSGAVATRLAGTRVALQAADPGAPDLQDAFRTWFEGRIAALPATGRHVVPGTADEERSEADLSAHDVLAGVTTWPAPLPHQLGLAFRVDVSGLGADEAVLVVPALGGAGTGVSGGGTIGVTAGGAMVEVPYDRTSRAYTACHAGVSHPNPTLNDSLIGPKGFVKQEHPDEEFGRAVRRIEHKAGALFTGHLAAAAIRPSDWPGPEPKEGETKDEAQRRRDRRSQFFLVCLACRAATTVATALDTVLLALLMPGRDTTREGQVLGPFLDLLVRGASDRSVPHSVARRDLRNAVRNGLKAWIEGQGPERMLDFCTPPRQNTDELDKTLLARALTRFAESGSDDDFKRAAAEASKIEDKAGQTHEEALHARLDQELAGLNDAVLSEQGVERVILEIFGAKPVKQSATTGTDGFRVTEEEYCRAREDFSALVEKRLNGAEAARQSVGSLMADLASGALGTTTPTLEDLRCKLTEFKFWHRRLLAEDSASLPMPFYLPRLGRPIGNLMTGAGLSKEAGAKQALRAALVEAAAEMEHRCLADLFPLKGARFVPDHAPQPLLAPIAVDPYVDDETNGPDSFSASFAGLGVLVRQGDGAAWAHACLAEFVAPKQAAMEPQGPPVEQLPLTVAPLPTAIVDGRRELFISYSGQPFASAAYADSIGDADRDKGVPRFFTLDHPAVDRMGGFAELPPLAYGRKYQFAVHVVGRSGALPRDLQDGLPWKPRRDTRDSLPVALTAPVSRRTALGRVTFADGSENRPPRIGLRPEGVRPLSADDRRIALPPGIAVDVLRNSNGTGVITLNADGRRRVVLRELQCWGDEGHDCLLTVAISGRPDMAPLPDSPTPDFVGSSGFVLQAGLVGELILDFARLSDEIEVEIYRPDVPGKDTLRFRPEDDTAFWIRLTVTGGCSVSLADPTLDWDGQPVAGRGEPDGLLLLGADERWWQPPFGTPAALDVVLPRMGLADFLRWTNNKTLRNEALELDDGADQDRKDRRIERFDWFCTQLVALDILRLTNAAAAKWLDRLPDLAVSAVVLTASPLDSLVRPPDSMATHEGQARTWEDTVPMPSLWSLIDPHGRETLDILTLMAKIDAALRHRMEAAAGDRGCSKTHLQVGAGLVVRVSARPLVPKRHFEATGDDVPAITPELLQYALGSRDAAHVFDGAHLTLEAMTAPLALETGFPPENGPLPRAEWAKDCQDVVAVVPAGSARTYQLVLSPSPTQHWAWRRVGSVRSWTQLWRFGGRPIRHWIKPRSHAVGLALAADQASIPITKVDSDFLAFETDAFLGRDDDDAQPETTVLAPVGHSTVLLTVAADERKGATLFRHAFTLVSRYAAVMRNPDTAGSCDAWLTSRQERWRRVVVLGKHETSLTRPQLRTLIPLTRRAGSDGFAPPVLAILNEEPFAFGGLAARIAPEIRTAVGYVEQRGKAGEASVRPQDIRKEVGPDGRLIMEPLAADLARRAVLPAEGPVGLTFDREDNAAVAFANTALLLHPMLLPPVERGRGEAKQNAAPIGDTASGVSEESFISVALRRYLDPDWLVADDPGTAPAWTGETTLWLDVSEQFRMLIGFVPVIVVDDSGVAVHPHLLDRTVCLQSSTLFTLCEHPDRGLALLLVPQGKERFSVGVLAVPDPALVQTGNSPVLVASIECQLDKGETLSFSDLKHGASVRRTVASVVTTLEWVRTNPDFDRITLVTQGRPPLQVTASTVTAFRQSDGTLAFQADGEDTWIRADQATRPVPTHTQRHVVCLFSRFLRGPGEAIEQPMRPQLLIGQTLRVPADAESVRLIEVETPAQILTFPSDRMPAAYRCGHFDLVAIGAAMEAGAPRRRFLFRTRLAGSPPKDRWDMTLNLNLNLDLDGAVKAVEIIVTGLDGESCELLLDVVVSRQTEDQVEVDWLLFTVTRTGGIQLTAKPEVRPKFVSATPIGWLSLAIIKASLPEVWLETSMLAFNGSGKRPEPASFADEAFDFDWLFGARSDGRARIDDPVTVAGLHEAQARCIRVSPPIAIQAGSPAPEG